MLEDDELLLSKMNFSFTEKNFGCSVELSAGGGDCGSGGGGGGGAAAAHKAVLWKFDINGSLVMSSTRSPTVSEEDVAGGGGGGGGGADNSVGASFNASSN